MPWTHQKKAGASRLRISMNNKSVFGGMPTAPKSVSRQHC